MSSSSTSFFPFERAMLLKGREILLRRPPVAVFFNQIPIPTITINAAGIPAAKAMISVVLDGTGSILSPSKSSVVIVVGLDVEPFVTILVDVLTGVIIVVIVVV